MFGGLPSHSLRDALRTWLERHPDEFEAIRRQRPAGPLAITYRTGEKKTSKGNPMRYDHLWHTDDLTVDTIEHHYHDAVDVGSDHALVWARFSTTRPASNLDSA